MTVPRNSVVMVPPGASDSRRLSKAHGGTAIAKMCQCRDAFVARGVPEAPIRRWNTVPRIRLALVALACAAAALTTLPAHAVDQPAPNSLAYLARDVGNMSDAYGRVTGPGGQLA